MSAPNGPGSSSPTEARTQPAEPGVSPTRAKRQARTLPPPLHQELLRPGLRLAVAVSGGADSVALLRALVALNRACPPGGEPGVAPGPASGLGLVLSVAHMHHGIRGDEADADAAFVEALAARLGLRVHRKHVDAPAMAHTQSIGLEEAARSLRYGWFAEMLASGAVDAVATAHTLNDQAETVLHKLIRGAWTEGLSGIHPILKPEAAPAGLILRPLLGATREQIVAWLGSIDQPWREDASNSDISYTRNRIRHQLLIQLATFNPRIAQQLAQVATIARDEEAYWQKEVERLLPDLLLPGRAVRGGGRATSTMPGERSLAIEVERLRGLHPALMRRLLRAAARELGFSLDFEQTARLLALVQGPANTRREQLTGELRAERTPRELRLLSAKQPGASLPSATAAVEIPVPGEGEGFGWRIRCSLASPSAASQSNALLRAAIPNDRVQLRYSRGAPKRIKEVFERMGIPPDQRAGWPVLIWRGEIVWMQGAVLEPSPVSLAIRLLTDRLR